MLFRVYLVLISRFAEIFWWHTYSVISSRPGLGCYKNKQKNNQSEKRKTTATTQTPTKSQIKVTTPPETTS
ncbi:hypothetical protein GQ457_16G006130 [Hibiscus cannabinus]